MLRWWEATELPRFLFALGFFTVLGFADWRRNPGDPRRLREYLFLAYGACVALVYGVLHDEITVTISPEYFLVFKGLAASEAHLRWAVAGLAVRASYWAGVALAAVLLVANNPGARPQLGYGTLRRLALVPLAAAALLALAGGIAMQHATLPRELATALPEPATQSRFLAVWGMHMGSYAGAVLGGLIAAWRTRKLRRGRTGPPAVMP